MNCTYRLVKSIAINIEFWVYHLPVE